MLNSENNPEFADLTKDIEEIRVLNYTKAGRKFTHRPDHRPENQPERRKIYGIDDHQ